jgi:hypothetical protein
LLVLVGVLLASVTACGGQRDDGARPVPTFDTGPRAAASPERERDTLLPTECAELLSGVGIEALLGQPIDSVQSRSVIGVSAPSVGRLEKVTCLYRRKATRGGPTDIQLNVYAYVDSTSASRHTATNIRSERASATAAEDLSLGSARGVLLDQGGQSNLLLSSGRSAIAMTMRKGVVPPEQSRAVMLDLAQRVLPNLAPEWTAESR